MAARKWTDEQKAAQSTAIHNWKPWQHSTGPKTAEGKAISSINAHRGYFRRRARLGQWLLRARYNTSVLTPELIIEAMVHADKLDIQLPKSTEHEQFFNDLATGNAEAGVALVEARISSLKISELFQVSALTQAARQTVLGRY
jgi:hypothetical protein